MTAPDPTIAIAGTISAVAELGISLPTPLANAHEIQRAVLARGAGGDNEEAPAAAIATAAPNDVPRIWHEQLNHSARHSAHQPAAQAMNRAASQRLLTAYQQHQQELFNNVAALLDTPAAAINEYAHEVPPDLAADPRRLNNHPPEAATALAHLSGTCSDLRAIVDVLNQVAGRVNIHNWIDLSAVDPTVLYDTGNTHGGTNLLETKPTDLREIVLLVAVGATVRGATWANVAQQRTTFETLNQEWKATSQKGRPIWHNTITDETRNRVSTPLVKS